MSGDQVSAATARIERARAALEATGETIARSGGGRAPARSDRFKMARAELHAAYQERNRVLIAELGTESDVVPLELAQSLGLTGREAAHIVASARTGTPRMQQHLFGRADHCK